MKSQDKMSRSADKTAIGLSIICTLHCLLLPVATALLPSAALFGLDDELFHVILLIVVLPVSVFALRSGMRKHNSKTVLAIGVAGLLVLIVTAAIGHDTFGETGERILTLFGSFLVATSHFRNFRLCQLRAVHPAME